MTGSCRDWRPLSRLFASPKALAVATPKDSHSDWYRKWGKTKWLRACAMEW